MRISICALAMSFLAVSFGLMADTHNSLTYLGTNQFEATNTDVASQYDLTIATYNLDGLHNLENQISANLPENPDEAQRMAEQRLNSIDESVTTKILYGSSLVIKWDIKKLPAFVFGDGQYVIYGVTDTNIAIKRFINSSQIKEF